MDSFNILKTFFESKEVAFKATGVLGKKARGKVILEDGECLFRKEKKIASVFKEEAKKVDFTLKLNNNAVVELTSLESEDVGEFGVKFFKKLKNKDGVELDIHIGFFKIITRGYLKVLLLGGPVVKTMAKRVFSK